MLNSMPRIKILEILCLTHVSLSFIYGVNPIILNQLTSLKYNSRHDILTNELVDFISLNCRNLLALNLIRYDLNMISMVEDNLDTNYLSFIRQNPQMQHLSFSAIHDMTNMLHQIMISMPKIQILSLSKIESNEHIPLDTVRAVLEKCTLLEDVTIYNKSQGSIQYRKHHDNIDNRNYFSFDCRYTLTRTDIDSLITLIKSLHIYTMEFWELSGFTEADYKAILCSNANVRMVLLSQFSRSLNQNVLRDMLSTNPNMTKIHVWHCLHDMTSEQLHRVFTTTPNKLTTLHISYHPTLTTSAVNDILLANPGIVDFGFEQCPLVKRKDLVHRLKQNLLQSQSHFTQRY